MLVPKCFHKLSVFDETHPKDSLNEVIVNSPPGGSKDPTTNLICSQIPSILVLRLLTPNLKLKGIYFGKGEKRETKIYLKCLFETQNSK